MKKQSSLLGIVGTLGAKLISALQPSTIQKKVNLPINEHLTLLQIRERRALSQADLAAIMHFTQTQVEEIEARSDMYVSTLRRQIEAMGAKLDLVVYFPGEQPVILRSVGDLTTRFSLGC